MYYQKSDVNEDADKEKPYYYHNDHLGTPQRMTDSAGVIRWSADYKPFGEATITVSLITNNLRGAGQYFDVETSLLYNYFRDLDTTTGRYKQADRIGLRGGINLFAHVDNNPLGYVDPLGLRGGVMTPAGPMPIYISCGPKATAEQQQQAIDDLKRLLGLFNPMPLANFLLDNIFNQESEDTADRPPAGSRDIDKTPWSGDHKEIKRPLGIQPDGKVKIDPSNDNVWTENPDGTWTNHGPAGDFTNSGRPSGRRGKDRDNR